MSENIITIRRRDVTYANEAFANLMAKTENALNRDASINPLKYSKINAFGLEKESLNVIKQMSDGTPFDANEILLISGQKFPDIIAEKYYGVEVKSTNSDHWKSTGSSIVESTRDEFVENIYMLFGNLGGNPPRFKCRPYQDVLYDITVTHSPRYLIDMDLSEGRTIFDKMGTSYDEFRTSDSSIAQARKYYRKQAEQAGKSEMPWWLTNENIERPVGMNVRLWNSLSSAEKTLLIAKCLILFPELIDSDTSTNVKYNNATLWLCTSNSVINPHIRDSFSAGGKISKVNGTPITPKPKIYKTIVKHSELIKNLLDSRNITKDFYEQILEYNPNLDDKKVPFYNKWLECISVIAAKEDVPIVDWIEKNAHLE